MTKSSESAESISVFLLFISLGSLKKRMKFRILRKAQIGEVGSSSIENKFDFHPEKIEIIQKPVEPTIRNNEDQLKNDETPITAFEGTSESNLIFYNHLVYII